MLLIFGEKVEELLEAPKDFQSLLKAIESKFIKILPKLYKLKYEDEDQDLIMLGSNADYLQASNLISRRIYLFRAGLLKESISKIRSFHL
jgi:hypothetical protein